MTSPHRAHRAHAPQPHWRWPALVVLALLAACASPREASVQSAQQLIAAGQVEAGLAQLERAARTPPLDPNAYNAYVLQRDSVVGVVVRDGDAARAAGALDIAEDRYRTALRGRRRHRVPRRPPASRVAARRRCRRSGPAAACAPRVPAAPGRPPPGPPR